MILRRYYRRGQKYDYTISDEYLEELKNNVDYPEERIMKIDNASYDIVLQTPEEEYEWFMDSCNRVLANTRWYLDNVDKVATFRVNYSRIFPEKIKD